QMATIIVRAHEFKTSDTKVDINLKNVSPSHEKGVQILANLKITNQLDDFRPSEMTTRGQFASFLYRSHDIELDETTKPNEQYVIKNYNYDFSTLLKRQVGTLPQTDSASRWYDASESLVQYYLNPKNFKKDTKEYYQFLRLSG